MGKNLGKGRFGQRKQCGRQLHSKCNLRPACTTPELEFKGNPEKTGRAHVSHVPRAPGAFYRLLQHVTLQRLLTGQASVRVRSTVLGQAPGPRRRKG